MEMKELGSSGVMVTPIAFGAWAIGGWMWGGADRNDAIKAITTAMDLGITTIDTAPAYGLGTGEKIVGEAIKGQRDKVQILTKYGLRWDAPVGQYYFTSKDNEGRQVDIYRDASRERIIAECENSLKDLGTDYLDLYQIHWPDPLTPVEETMSAIEQLLKQGKIRAAGVCNYPVEGMKEAGKFISLVSNQVPYSMVRREIEQDVIPWCMKNGLSVLPYSPLQRGLLTGKIKPDYRFNDGDSRPSTPYFKIGNLIKINKFLDKIKPVAAARKVSLAQLVLRWTMQRPGITCVLAGARNPEQVKENAGALQFELSDEEMETINRYLDQLSLDNE
jgi:aryl-alcohol dehydrogenase-like predicted oxidoreductase